MTITAPAPQRFSATPSANRSMLQRLSAIAAAVILLAGLSGCGGIESKLPGTYSGSAGTTTLVLNKDGSALYSQVKDSGTDSGKGTWKVDDKTLRVNADSLDYEIFANLEGFDGSLMFESEDSSWNSEIYTQQK